MGEEVWFSGLRPEHLFNPQDVDWNWTSGRALHVLLPTSKMVSSNEHERGEQHGQGQHRRNRLSY